MIRPLSLCQTYELFSMQDVKHSTISFFVIIVYRSLPFSVLDHCVVYLSLYSTINYFVAVGYIARNSKNSLSRYWQILTQECLKMFISQGLIPISWAFLTWTSDIEGSWWWHSWISLAIFNYQWQNVWHHLPLFGEECELLCQSLMEEKSSSANLGQTRHQWWL